MSSCTAGDGEEDFLMIAGWLYTQFIWHLYGIYI